MRLISILLILAIGIAGAFGILAVALPARQSVGAGGEIRSRRPKYEGLIKICYVLIGIIGAVLAWLVYLGG